MTTAIYFDCDGTLLTFEGEYADLFATACEEVGLDADPESLSATYSERFFEAFEAFHPEPYHEGTRVAFEQHDIDTAPERFVDALLEAEITDTVVDAGAHDALDRFDDDARLGVLTNGVPTVQRRKLERHDLFERFDGFLPSYEVGAHKPSPEIFEAARERLPADEHVYVGDSLEADIRPAREAGFLPVHVDRTSEAGVAIDHLGTLGRAAELL
ncbi:MAG: HAD family hydrolase [Halolamina sp.]|uniref:HAD family hydrolase n=1 Tax=Halolamina sp. TaxID=1940283 RepID=UPI002FC3BFFC